MTTLVMKELTPALWPALERLFGENGACGGCWCMSWRIEPGERWAEVKGAPAKRRLKELVLKGRVNGVIAFDGETPVGWCTFGPRLEFPRLNRARTLACDDPEAVWSIPCFFVPRARQGQSIASQLLRFVVQRLRARGVRLAEGYPVKLPADGAQLPAAFAWTGTPSMFLKTGFKFVGSRAHSKLRLRRKV